MLNRYDNVTMAVQINTQSHYSQVEADKINSHLYLCNEEQLTVGNRQAVNDVKVQKGIRQIPKSKQLAKVETLSRHEHKSGKTGNESNKLTRQVDWQTKAGTFE